MYYFEKISEEAYGVYYSDKTNVTLICVAPDTEKAVLLVKLLSRSFILYEGLKEGGEAIVIGGSMKTHYLNIGTRVHVQSLHDSYAIVESVSTNPALRGFTQQVETIYLLPI